MKKTTKVLNLTNKGKSIEYDNNFLLWMKILKHLDSLIKHIL